MKKTIESLKNRKERKRKRATDDLTDDLTDIKTKGKGEYEKEKCICSKKAPLAPPPLSLFDP